MRTITTKSVQGPSPRRVALGGVLALAVAAGTTLSGAAPAQSVPDPACPAAYPTGELVRDQRVSGLTVSQGVTPAPFDGTVIGVLSDGIAPDVDMIMARLDSPEIARVGGIWAGMSGSPVYAADGRLIGAVSYGLTGGASPVAGITPAADMQALLNAVPDASAAAGPESVVAADQVDIPASTALTIESMGAATRTETAGGLERLAMPLGISGLANTRRMNLAARSFGFDNVHIYRSSAASSASSASSESSSAAESGTVVPGGNLAASASYGDVSVLGVGTVTAVCGNEVLAFGHPAFYTGPSSLTMHAADALYIQEDSLGVPFKVANATGVVGTIDRDRMVGLHGVVGAAPRTTRITSVVEVDGVSRTGTTYISVPAAVPDIAALHLLADQDKVFDGLGAGSANVSWTVTGLRADGQPFAFSRADRYTDTSDVTFSPAGDLYDQLATLQDNELENLTITSVRTSSVLTRQVRKYIVRGVQVLRAGAWAVVDDEHPVIARSGSTLRLRISLGSYRNLLGTRTVRASVEVPENVRMSSGRLKVMGGAPSGFDDLFGLEFLGGFGDLFGGGQPEPTTVAGLLEKIKRAPTHDKVVASLSLFRRAGTAKVRVPMDAVVAGGINVPVMVFGPRR